MCEVWRHSEQCELLFRKLVRAMREPPLPAMRARCSRHAPLLLSKASRAACLVHELNWLLVLVR
eukprot:scaffold22743_cov28-Tisochrysis_lutea.AAC.1